MNEKNFHKALGLVTSIIAKSPEYKKSTIELIVHWIYPAIYHEKIKIFYDKFKNPIGYITWALLADDVIDRIINSNSLWLHESEWNEGDNLWIIDICLPFGGIINHRKEIKKILRAHNSINYCRVTKRKGKKILKINNGISTEFKYIR